MTSLFLKASSGESLSDFVQSPTGPDWPVAGDCLEISRVHHFSMISTLTFSGIRCAKACTSLTNKKKSQRNKYMQQLVISYAKHHMTMNDFLRRYHLTSIGVLNGQSN
mmetsp:Transcript_9055/g.20027  ORF Transcript_9055/g.20027 Transcript_9055/m.20027 type:complete len:108 (-) Transcript_9055:226-549(-)